MKANYLIIALLIWGLKANAKLILVDFSFPDYKFNKQQLLSKKGDIFLINCLRKEYLSNSDNLAIRPLLVFQAFDFQMKLIEKPKIDTTSSFTNYLEQIQPELIKDMKLDIDDFLRSPRVGFVNIVYDSLIINENEVYTLLTGVIRLDFFNVLPYEQYHPLQSNRTVFNIKAPVVSINRWTSDSIPVPAVKFLDKKTFLLKKTDSEYTFYVYPLYSEHNDLSFVTAYTYRNEYGVVAVWTKYLQWVQRYPNGTGRKLQVGEYVWTQHLVTKLLKY
jgi:hypothetical protein